MNKKRYTTEFKSKVIFTIFITLLIGFFFIGSAISLIQYYTIIGEMQSNEAKIVDIEYDPGFRRSSKDIYITYTIDGMTYNNQYKTEGMLIDDVSFQAHYSVGDTVEIFYDPNDPNIIAAPRSATVASGWLLVSVIPTIASICSLVYTLSNSHKYLVTQEEYKNEKEELRKVRALNKQRGDKFKSMERKKQIYDLLTRRRNRF